MCVAGGGVSLPANLICLNKLLRTFVSMVLDSSLGRQKWEMGQLGIRSTREYGTRALAVPKRGCSGTQPQEGSSRIIT